jgi:hypothetical protein
MGLANLAQFLFLWQRLEEFQEGLNLNGLMILEVGLDVMCPKIEHVAFIVSYLEKEG